VGDIGRQQEDVWEGEGVGRYMKAARGFIKHDTKLIKKPANKPGEDGKQRR